MARLDGFELVLPRRRATKTRCKEPCLENLLLGLLLIAVQYGHHERHGVPYAKLCNAGHEKRALLECTTLRAGQARREEERVAALAEPHSVRFALRKEEERVLIALQRSGRAGAQLNPVEVFARKEVRLRGRGRRRWHSHARMRTRSVADRRAEGSERPPCL